MFSEDMNTTPILEKQQQVDSPPQMEQQHLQHVIPQQQLEQQSQQQLQPQHHQLQQPPSEQDPQQQGRQQPKKRKYRRRVHHQLQQQQQASKQQQFECELCDFQTSLLPGYSQHIMTNHNEAEQQYLLCCNKYGLQIDDIIINMEDSQCKNEVQQNTENTALMVPMLDNEKKAKSHECGTCGEEFPKLDTLKQHIASAHQPEQEEKDDTPEPKKTRSRKCETCGKEFTRYFNLRQHMESVHQGNQAGGNVTITTTAAAEHVDPEIAKSMENGTLNLAQEEDNISKYAKSMISKKTKSLDCGTCGYTFTTRFNLKHHMVKMHSSSHVCDICSEEFTRSDNLKRHIQSSHKKSGSFNCNSCEQSFKRIDNLQKHVKKVHKKRK